MTKVVHRADNRGIAEHGWLYSRHSFSFGHYYNPDMLGFGSLLVINDDSVDGDHGFDAHSHRDMEIISIPLEGSLEHVDTTGSKLTINPGEIQIMSAGTGIAHSEHNASQTEPVKFLQIWVVPKENGIAPRYAQQYFNLESKHNHLQLIISGDKSDTDALYMHQNAYFSLGEFDFGQKLEYQLRDNRNGVYVFVIEGQVEIAQELLNRRDAMGLTELEVIPMHCVEPSTVLAMEVPMVTS